MVPGRQNTGSTQLAAGAGTSYLARIVNGAKTHRQVLETGEWQEVTALVRTPIDTAPPLLERAQRLLLQIWPRARSGDRERAPRLLAIELKVGEFAQPSQLFLSDFDRLDGGGTLKGLSSERRQALVRHDEAFQARYGTTAFQHVTAVDAGNILTERRFRWESGLPWSAGVRRKRS